MNLETQKLQVCLFVCLTINVVGGAGHLNAHLVWGSCFTMSPPLAGARGCGGGSGARTTQYTRIPARVEHHNAWIPWQEKASLGVI